jgi:hypothetical protein
VQFDKPRYISGSRDCDLAGQNPEVNISTHHNTWQVRTLSSISVLYPSQYLKDQNPKINISYSVPDTPGSLLCSFSFYKLGRYFSSLFV